MVRGWGLGLANKCLSQRHNSNDCQKTEICLCRFRLDRERCGRRAGHTDVRRVPEDLRAVGHRPVHTAQGTTVQQGELWPVHHTGAQHGSRCRRGPPTEPGQSPSLNIGAHHRPQIGPSCGGSAQRHGCCGCSGSGGGNGSGNSCCCGGRCGQQRSERLTHTHTAAKSSGSAGRWRQQHAQAPGGW